MELDGREMDIQDLLRQLKEILSSKRECFLSIDVLTRTLADAKKITGFASMSGCTATIDTKDNYCIIHVRGIPCCT
ncbi:MAG: hypothetical protein C4581_13500 [Nitrospiraceae bacterium]|nr:MAG: hypothetical protein C4581_13500 [Nitrospiraceae bacterium]